jgi:DNA-binding MarR family transcriptional regulator
MVPSHAQFAQLASELRGMLAVTRGISRWLPPEYPVASTGVLSVLARHGDIRASRLAELLDIDMSVTSRHVAHLAERGCIDRLPDPHDGRSRLLRITPLGQQVLRTASDRVAEALADHLRDWPDEDIAQFCRLLARLHADFGDCRPRSRPVPADPADTPGIAAPGNEHASVPRTYADGRG